MYRSAVVRFAWVEEWRTLLVVVVRFRLAGSVELNGRVNVACLLNGRREGLLLLKVWVLVVRYEAEHFRNV